MPVGATSEGRAILFKLQLASDPRNSEAASKFKDEADRARTKMRTPPSESSSAPENKRSDNAEREAKKAAKAEEREIAQTTKLIAQATKEAETEAKRKSTNAEREARKTAAAEEREIRKTTAEVAKATREQEAEDARLHDRNRNRQLERARRNRSDLEDRFAGARRAGETEGKESARGSEAAVRAHEQASQKIRASTMQIREGGMMAAEGIMSMARGAALLGVMGEKDLAKFLKQVAQIEAVISLARGGASVWFGLTKAMEAYQTRVIATTAAENALAAAQARRAVAATAANAAGGKGPGGGLGSINQKLAGSASTMSAAGQQYAQTAATGSAPSAAATATGAVALVAAIASISMACTEASEIANGTAGEIDSLTSRMGRFNEWVHRGVLDLVNPQGAKAATGQVYTNAAEAQKKTDRMLADRERKESKKGDDEKLGDIRSRQGSELIDKRLNEIQFRVASANMRGSKNMTDTERESSNAFSEKHELGKELEALQAAKKFKDTDKEREGIQRDIEKVQQRMVENAKQMVTLAQREGAEKIKAAKDAIDKMREEIALKKEAAKDARESLMSGKERFGNMSGEEQQRVLRAASTLQEAERLRKAGQKNEASRMFASVNKEDRQLAGSMGLKGTTDAARQAAIEEADRVGKAPRPTLNREALTRLAKIKERQEEIDRIEENRANKKPNILGMQKNVDFTKERDGLDKEKRRLEREVRESMKKIPDGPGFDSVMGWEERATAKAADEAQKVIELRVKDERKMILKVESDYVEQARGLANEAAVQMKRLETQLTVRFAEELEVALASITKAAVDKAMTDKTARR